MNFCPRPDPRCLFQQGWPLTSLQSIKTSPKWSISLWILSWPLSTARIPLFPAADQLHSSFQGTLSARNSSPGIPSLLPSAVLGEVGRFLHTESHTMWRIKYWSYFCCKAWRNKMLSVFLKVVFASFPALPRDVFFSSEWNLWMAQGVCCAQCVCTSSFSPPTPGILPDAPFFLLHLFQIPLPKLTDSLSCPRSGNFSFIPGGRNAQARESNIALQRL